MEKQYFKVGDTVYSQTYGEGVIKNIFPTSEYPISVIFKNRPIPICFTYDGRYTTDCPICLSKSPIPKIFNESIKVFDLTFSEAMKEVFENNKKIQCEYYGDKVYFYNEVSPPIKTNVLCMKSEKEDSEAHLTPALYNSKWRVTE